MRTEPRYLRPRSGSSVERRAAMATRAFLRFGDLVRRHRTAAALSQEALAERAGLSKRGISDLERGARLAPRFETVRLLADALALGDADRLALLAAARPVLRPDDALGPPPAVPITAPQM